MASSQRARVQRSTRDPSTHRSTRAGTRAASVALAAGAAALSFISLAAFLTLPSCVSDLRDPPALGETPPGTEAGTRPDADGGTKRDGQLGPKYLLGSRRADFAFELHDLGIGHHTGKALDDAITEHGLADVIERRSVANTFTGKSSLLEVDSDGFPIPLMSEWDTSLIHFASGDIDGAGLARITFSCFDERQGCAPPENPAQAFERANLYFKTRKDFSFTEYPAARRLIARTGHDFFQHYGAAWGAGMVVSKVGENVNSTQAHIAFTRGAGRQYAIPWGIDMSPWFGRGVIDYSSGVDRVWCERDSAGTCGFYNSGKDHGHSLSLHTRTWYLSYLAGANYLLQEGASINFFDGPEATAAISPLGLLAKDFQTFVRANPDRGTPHVPFAIVVDYFHGLGPGTWTRPAGQEQTWNHFAMSETERSTLALLDAFWPGSFRMSPTSEANYLVDGPVGDSADVLAETVDAATLRKYPVVFLSGAVHWTPTLKAAVQGVIGAGGWLILDKNSIHDAIYSDLGSPELHTLVPGYTVDQIGVADVTGHIVRVASPTHYPALLAELSTTFVPFSVTGGAGFALSSRGPKSWILALVNNAGVDKAPLTPTVVTGGPRTIVVSPRRGARLKGATALRSVRPETLALSGLSVEIDPGDVAVFALELD